MTVVILRQSCQLFPYTAFGFHRRGSVNPHRPRYFLYDFSKNLLCRWHISQGKHSLCLHRLKCAYYRISIQWKSTWLTLISPYLRLYLLATQRLVQTVLQLVGVCWTCNALCLYLGVVTSAVTWESLVDEEGNARCCVFWYCAENMPVLAAMSFSH